MACAIFNPFCCCTAGLLSAAEDLPTLPTMPMEHSCCQAEAANTDSAPAKPEQPHDPDACPHKVLKESQATSVTDAAGVHFAPEPLPFILTLVQVITFEPVAQIAPRIQVAELAQAPPLTLTQRYSVFRI